MDDFRFYSRALSPADVMAAMAAEVPVTSNYGSGCAQGGAGIPTLRADSPPQIGTNFDMVVEGFEAGASVTIYVSPFTSVDPVGGLPLPFDLGSVLPGLFGGCTLEVGIAGSSRGLGSLPAGTGSTTFVLPALPLLQGVHIYAQALGLSGAGGQLTPAIDANLQN